MISITGDTSCRTAVGVLIDAIVCYQARRKDSLVGLIGLSDDEGTADLGDKFLFTDDPDVIADTNMRCREMGRPWSHAFLFVSPERLPFFAGLFKAALDDPSRLGQTQFDPDDFMPHAGQNGGPVE